jgi:predicted nucleic acid-binding protein
MKIFLDANILVAVLNKEYPLFSYAARILSLSNTRNYKVYTSPICLAIAFYFAEKKSGTRLALKKIKLLSSNIQITTVDQKCVEKTTLNKKITDFEDGIEYYSALEAGCKVIITEDTGDFWFSEAEVLTCGMFIEKYLS